MNITSKILKGVIENRSIDLYTILPHLIMCGTISYISSRYYFI